MQRQPGAADLGADDAHAAGLPLATSGSDCADRLHAHSASDDLHRLEQRPAPMAACAPTAATSDAEGASVVASSSSATASARSSPYACEPAHGSGAAAGTMPLADVVHAMHVRGDQPPQADSGASVRQSSGSSKPALADNIAEARQAPTYVPPFQGNALASPALSQQSSEEALRDMLPVAMSPDESVAPAPATHQAEHRPLTMRTDSIANDAAQTWLDEQADFAPFEDADAQPPAQEGEADVEPADFGAPPAAVATADVGADDAVLLGDLDDLGPLHSDFVVAGIGTEVRLAVETRHDHSMHAAHAAKQYLRAAWTVPCASTTRYPESAFYGSCPVSSGVPATREDVGLTEAVCNMAVCLSRRGMGCAGRTGASADEHGTCGGAWPL